MTEIIQPDPRSFTSLLEAVADLPPADQLEGMLALMEEQDRAAVGKMVKKNCAILEVNGGRLEINDVAVTRKGRMMGNRHDRTYTLTQDPTDEEWYNDYGGHGERGVYTYTELTGTVVIADGQPLPLKQQYDRSPTLFFHGQPEEIWKYTDHLNWGSAARRFREKGFEQVIFTEPRAAYPLLKMHGFGKNDRAYQSRHIAIPSSRISVLRMLKRRGR